MIDNMNAWQVICSETQQVIYTAYTFGGAVCKCNAYNAHRGPAVPYAYVISEEAAQERASGWGE